MQQTVLQIAQCPSRDSPVHLYHLGDGGAVPPLSTQHEPFLIVTQRLFTPLQLPPVKEPKNLIICMTMHEHFLMVAQPLLTPLQLPPVKERKFDHTHDNA
jgi:hypothetical protein